MELLKRIFLSRELLCLRKAISESHPRALNRLYASLGSPRLGQLIKEEYKPVGEIREAPDAAKIRKLVLERLPLFLHERNQTRVLIRPEWMQNAS
jgi:Protein of unknown function (DUF3684)